MATLKLNGNSSGFVNITTNAAAANNTITLPDVTDTVATVTNPTFLNSISLAATTGTSPTLGLFSPSANVLAFSTSVSERIRITATGNVGINTTAPTRTLDVQGNVNVLNTVIMGSSFLRNRIINGGMSVDQRNSGASQTITAGAALAYTADRFYAYCTGANVTGQRIANTINNPASNPSQYVYQFTGAASVTAIGFGTRIEAVNCWDLAGTTATLSVNLANGLLTTVTWTASYANSADSFGTLASPTVTQIATGTFTVTAALSRYSVSIPIPTAATTGIQIVFTVGAQTSATWQINNVQLEPGPVATPFERRQYGQELALCQRYFALTPIVGTGIANGTTACDFMIAYPVQMRAAASITARSILTITNSVASDFTQSAANISNVFANGLLSAYVRFGNFTSLTSGSVYNARAADQTVNTSAEL